MKKHSSLGLRALFLLIAVPTTLQACGGEVVTDDDAGSPMTDGGTTTPPPPPPPEEITWAGTWSAHVEYTAVCMWSSIGAPRTVDLSYNVTAQITGENSSVTAVFANEPDYTMTGSGNADRLLLSGLFPGRDHDNDLASRARSENNVSISLTEVIDRDTARGSIEGNYDTSGGISCVIQDGGSIELSR